MIVKITPQIEEMARTLCGEKEKTCSKCDSFALCEFWIEASTLHNAGYRKQEWISVEDRLPTDEKQVLAYYDFAHGDGSFGMPFIGVLCYFAHDLNPHWQHESTGLRVTHWMPLPEPPKGE